MSKAGETAVFTYNADGLRVKKVCTTTGTTNYTLHGKNVVHLSNGSNNLHFFYDAQNRPAVVVFNGAAYGYIHNLQGDIVAIVNNSGTKVVEYVYDAWGKLISKTGTLASTLGMLNPFRYRGYIYDEETGLYYLKSRCYSSELCRFVNSDAVFVINTSLYLCLNLFTYCENQPVDRCDPDGYADPDLVDDDTGDLLDNMWRDGKGGSHQRHLKSGAKSYRLKNTTFKKLNPKNSKPQNWKEAELLTRNAIRDYSSSQSTRTTSTSMGKRIVDAINQYTNTIAESKMGKTSLNTRTSLQVAKDVEIMNTPSYRIDTVEWHFYHSPHSDTIGPTAPLRYLLEYEGIHIIIHP